MTPKVENPNIDTAVNALYHQNRAGKGTGPGACPARLRRPPFAATFSLMKRVS